jgi:hypothetical protein
MIQDSGQGIAAEKRKRATPARDLLWPTSAAKSFFASLIRPAAYTQIADDDLTEILTVVNRLLPNMGGIEHARDKGFESESAIAPSILTQASDRAALRNNEIR